MIEVILSVLIAILIYLCFKTIRIQSERITKLEAFASDYLEGKSERKPLHERHSKDLQPVGGADSGRHRTPEE